MSVITIIIIGLGLVLFLGLRNAVRKKSLKLNESIMIVVTLLSFLLYLGASLMHEGHFGEAVDSVDTCYFPFCDDHFPTFLWYALSFFIAVFLAWKKSEKLSPIGKSVVLAILTAGTVLFFAAFLQVISHRTEKWDSFKGNDGTLGFIWFPLIMTSFGIIFISKLIAAESQISTQRTYRNKFLQSLNGFLARKGKLPIGLFIMLFPFLIVSTLILILFGQEYDSAIKVFTETYLWTFSQHVPPPPLDHQGHYLCTVAAHGSPKMVKPKYIGLRGGRKIIVNRQLQVANAFEEIIEQKFPKIHHFIRVNYDKHGYNLSRKIITKERSNLVYLLMKPLELCFLLFIYTFDAKPEVRIHRQYIRK